MKHMKRIFALALALVMVLGLATTAFAEGTEEPAAPAGPYSITINNATPGHTYEAYQIFKGDLKNPDAEDAADAPTTNVLSNIVWGASVTNATTLGDASAYAEALAKGDKTVEDLIANVTLGEAFADSEETVAPYVIEGLEPGYYLIKDLDGSLTGKDDAYTEFILEVIENSTVNPKSSVPEVEKKVKDINDSTDTKMTDWQDSADHDINDDVPFQLKATLANNVSAYDTYKIVFHDTLSAGLTYNGDFEVYLGSVSDENKVTSHFTPSYNAATGELTFTCNNVKAFGATNNSVIIVEYTAKLNENAVIGSAGNPNEVYLEYSNNPNWKPDGEDDQPETGETPNDKVIVFTYKLDVNKIAKGENDTTIELEGAEFTLEKQQADGTWKPIALTVAGNVFSSTGLDDGVYRLTETKAPEGYNKLTAPIYFKVEATHDEEAKEPTLQTLTVTLIDEEGNVIADVESGDLGSFTADRVAGAIATDVVNKAGIVLPETGGMGTTLFYVFGGILVLSAVVLMVTKKRMASF